MEGYLVRRDDRIAVNFLPAMRCNWMGGGVGEGEGGAHGVIKGLRLAGTMATLVKTRSDFRRK